jgi:hypothetical protein
LSKTNGQQAPQSTARYLPFGQFRTEPTAELTELGYNGRPHRLRRNIKRRLKRIADDFVDLTALRFKGFPQNNVMPFQGEAHSLRSRSHNGVLP